MEKDKKDAGQVTARLSYSKPGTYDVTVRIKYSISQGAGSIGAKMRVELADKSGGVKAYELPYDEMHTQNKKGFRKISKSLTVHAFVRIGADGVGTIAIAAPVISGASGTGKAVIEMFVVSVKPI